MTYFGVPVTCAKRRLVAASAGSRGLRAPAGCTLCFRVSVGHREGPGQQKSPASFEVGLLPIVTVRQRPC
jgi:hypothetical protein